MSVNPGLICLTYSYKVFYNNSSFAVNEYSVITSYDATTFYVYGVLIIIDLKVLHATT